MRIEHIETSSSDTIANQGDTDSQATLPLRVCQKIGKLGDQVLLVGVVVRKPDGKLETATVEVRYHGLSGVR